MYSHILATLLMIVCSTAVLKNAKQPVHMYSWLFHQEISHLSDMTPDRLKCLAWTINSLESDGQCQGNGYARRRKQCDRAALGVLLAYVEPCAILTS